MIGIIIGIASVITIMSLGNGFKKSTTEQFNDAGAGKNQASISYMTENMEAPKNNPFKQEDMSVVEQVNGVKSAKTKTPRPIKMPKTIRPFRALSSKILIISKFPK